MATVALSRSNDVVVNIQRLSSDLSPDMSVGCVVVPFADKPASWSANQIVALYSDVDTFAADFPSAKAVHKAGVAFFAQSPRPDTLAIGITTGAVFESSHVAGVLTFANNPSAGDTVTIGSQTYRFESTMTAEGDVKIGADAATTITHLVKTINGTGVANTDFYTGTPDLTDFVTVASDSTTITLTALAATQVADVQLSESSSVITVSTPTDTSIATYAEAIQTSSIAGGQKLFGWALDSSFRNVGAQIAIANYCQSNNLAAFIVTNATAAYDNGSTTDIGYLLQAASNTAACVFYHDIASEYPEVAAMADQLSVDFSGNNTTRTLKFKTCVGITAANITQTQYQNLDAKNYNMVSKTGNTYVLTREGKNAANTWYTDEYVGIQNFREEIQSAVFNVFLSSPKVPYTMDGQLMLSQAAAAVCQRYVDNGFFADRQDTDAVGNTINLPAYTISNGNIATASASDRASRIGPPIAITCYLAGAIHKVTLNIDMVQ